MKIVKILRTVYAKSGWGAIYPGPAWTYVDTWNRMHGHGNMGSLSVRKQQALFSHTRPTQ